MSSVSALRSPLLASPIRKPSSTAGNSIPTTTVRYHRGGQSHALLGSLTIGHRKPNSITGGGAGGLRKIQCSSGTFRSRLSCYIVTDWSLFISLPNLNN